MTDGDDLRRAWLDGHVEDDAEPDPERIWRAVSGESSPEEVGAVLDRVAASPAWAEAWRIAHEGYTASAEEAEGASPMREAEIVAFPTPRRVWLLLAAAALLLAVPLLWHRGPGEDVYRAGPQHALDVRVASPAGDAGLVLQWEGGEPAWRYDVTITTASLEPVARLDGLRATRIEVPATSLAGIPSGTKLLWRVEARGADGGSMATAQGTVAAP